MQGLLFWAEAEQESKLTDSQSVPAADRTLNDQIQRLKKTVDEAVPEPVSQIEKLFADAGCWYLLGRNQNFQAAGNCEQAALIRSCLGYGIPLSRELKSALGSFRDETGQECRVVVHCRASHEIDFEKVNKVLGEGAKFERLELERDGKSDLYGLVNPFAIELASMAGKQHIQIFDSGVFEPDELPDSLITNAGDKTWSIEFRSFELERIISPRRFIRADVVSKRRPFWRRKIGILTGNSPESGALLWDVLLKTVREKRKEVERAAYQQRNPDRKRAKCLEPTGDVFMPEVHIRSLPAMGLTMELHLRRDQIWKRISPSIEEMCQDLSVEDGQKQNVLAIACNTTPHFAPEIRKIADKHNVHFLSISDAVEKFLTKRGIDEVVLLGIGYIHHPQFSGYGNLYSQGSAIKLHPISAEILKRIEDLAFAVKAEQHPNPRLKDKDGKQRT
ncbi:MAG: hypothetical protein AAF687_00450, partial [Pseudomonadota bacterium]